MKKYIILAVCACTLLGCGRVVATKKHEADKRSFDAWVAVQKQMHPEYLWKQTALGSWILEETPGTGSMITGSEDTVYARVNYTTRTTAGIITSTSTAKIAQQLGTYKESNYYGPIIWYLEGTYAALEELLTGMRDGARCKVAIPGWLLTYTRYDSPEKYLNDSTSNDPLICDLELVEHFRSVKDWELDSVARYLTHAFPKKYGSNPARARADSSGAHGFYYIQTQAPLDKTELNDTSVYINYIGRLLDGRVFDTNIRDTAIVHGTYSSSATYEPVAISYGTTWEDVKMGAEASSVIEGFALTLCKMHPGEKGTGVFWSYLGYGTDGTGSSIPGYSPLRFDIELVEK